MNKMPEQIVPENITERIRHLLNMTAEHGCSEAEASNAMAKATDLLEKYNLSIAEIKTSSPQEADLIRGEIQYEDLWERRLFGAVARNNFCRTVGDLGQQKVIILGRKPNVIATVEMGLWLKLQIEGIVLKEMVGFNGRMVLNQFNQIEFRNHKENKRSYKASFIDGMVARLGSRLQELKRERELATSSLSALTVRLDNEAEDFMRKLFPHLTNNRIQIKSSSGYSAGQTAANGVSLTASSRQIKSSSLQLGAGR
jgi:hypothetical protein